MSRFIIASRYLIIIPILGLGLAASAFFVIGGYGLLRLTVESLLEYFGLIQIEHGAESLPIIVEVVEYVHTFLIGTVLYITSIGFYQLFIKEINLPGWLKIDSTEELETSLVGVTVVVLAVNFLAVVYTGQNVDLLKQGGGIALPIAALGVFIGLRSWGAHLDRERHGSSNTPSQKDDDQ